MPRAKSIPAKDLNAHIEGENLAWFNEFVKSDPSRPYKDNAGRFLKIKIFRNKPFNQFIVDDILDFYDILSSIKAKNTTINNYLSAIIAFRDFLIKQYPDTFDPSFLSEIGALKHQHDELDSFDKIALNPNQICLIRKYADIKSKPLTLYIFELFFQLAIPKKDIRYCTVENANFDKMEFMTDKIPIKYNNVIQNLLLKHPNVIKNSNLNESSVSEKFKTLTKYILKNNEGGLFTNNRPICWEDITYSHSLFLFTCPVCGRKLENIASNWVLAKTELENEYRLVCALCEGGSHAS